MPSPEKRVRVERGLYKTGVPVLRLRHATRLALRDLEGLGQGQPDGGQAPARQVLRRGPGAPAPPLSATRRTFGDLASEWLAEQLARRDAGEMSPRTYEVYELALRRHVLPAFGAWQVRAIGPDELVKWIRKLRKAGYAPHSVHNYWGPLHLVLSYAVRRGVVAGSPADRLTSAERPKPGAGRRHFLDRHDVKLLLEAAPARYRVAIACGLFSGLRLSELLGLRGRTSTPEGRPFESGSRWAATASGGR